MVASKFQFQDPHIMEFSYTDNKSFVDQNFDGRMKIQFNTNISKDKSSPRAFVALEMILGDDPSNPFCIHLKMGSIFKWDELEDAIVNDLLSKNAPALLISYMRPIVGMITASSRFPTFNIPFIDFRSESDDYQINSESDFSE